MRQKTHDFNNLSISDYLDTIGIVRDDKKSKQNNVWYYSPFRLETSSSFKVNQAMNRWFDFGLGIGGNLIKFITTYYDIDYHQACNKLKNGNPDYYGYIHNEKNKVELKKGISVVNIGPITNPFLEKYITSRKIDLSLAKIYCEEAIIRFPNSKNPSHEYSVIAFENISNGYEFRNETLKLSNSPKDISMVLGDPSQLNVLEGFFDFLSYLQYYKIDKPVYDTMILNTLSFIERVNEYEFVNVYLDYGEAAEKAILKIANNVNDQRFIFEGYGDFNDFIKATK
jgi:hypothetical protein